MDWDCCSLSSYISLLRSDRAFQNLHPSRKTDQLKAPQIAHREGFNVLIDIKHILYIWVRESVRRLLLLVRKLGVLGDDCEGERCPQNCILSGGKTVEGSKNKLRAKAL